MISTDTVLGGVLPPCGIIAQTKYERDETALYGIATEVARVVADNVAHSPPQGASSRQDMAMCRLPLWSLEGPSS